MAAENVKLAKLFVVKDQLRGTDGTLVGVTMCVFDKGLPNAEGRRRF